LKSKALCIDLDLTSTQGEKRSIEHITDLSDDHSSSSSSNDSSYGDGINYKKRCVELEDRIKQLESEWMRMYDFLTEFFVHINERVLKL
jgi:hypothetical protein